MSTTVVIGDTHFPYTHPGYYDFICDTVDEWQPDYIIHIGDVVDWHSVTFHQRDPELDGPRREYEAACEMVDRWYQTFPVLHVMIGNHDKRPIRKLLAGDVPYDFMRTYAEVWNTPRWNWTDHLIREDVFYTHGDAAGGGMHPAFNLGRKQSMSCVKGHNHTAMGVKYWANMKQRYFAMDTGCGIDHRNPAYAYHKGNPERFLLGCGVVVDGDGFTIPMRCGLKEKYNRARFK